MLTIARWRHDLSEMMSQFEYLESQIEVSSMSEVELRFMIAHVLKKSRARLARQYDALTNQHVVISSSKDEGVTCKT